MNRLAGRYEPAPCPVDGCDRMHGGIWTPASPARRGQDINADRLGGGNVGGPAHFGPVRPHADAAVPQRPLVQVGTPAAEG